MKRLALMGIVGVGICGVAGFTLWIIGYSADDGASNALTELGSGLVGAALVALAVLGVEHGLENAQRNSDERRQQHELALEAERRREERARDARLTIALQSSLSGADLTDQQLDGIHLAGRNLSKSLLNGVSLVRANLRGADLTGPEATGARLTKAVATSAGLQAIRFSDCDMSNMDLTGAYLDDARITGGSLRGASLHAASCRKADFFRTDARGVDFTDANLTGAAGLRGSDFQAARANGRTKWPEDIDPAQLRGLVVYKDAPRGLAKLVEHFDLSGTYFSDVNLRGKRFVGVNFSDSWFRHVDFYHSVLIECDFSGADLADAGGLVGASFENCEYTESTQWPSSKLFPLHITKGLRIKSITARPDSIDDQN